MLLDKFQFVGMTKFEFSGLFAGWGTQGSKHKR
jgi:hypothetical protein